MRNLSGKVALVTGGSRGIGKAICERLAADGAFVIVNYATSQESAEKTVAAIEARGGRAAAVQADIATLDAIRGLYQKTDALLSSRLGATHIDILVNNAGVSWQETLFDVDEASYDRMMAVNLKAPFFLAQQVLHRMPDGGRIISISSREAHRVVSPSLVTYSIAKHGLTGLTRNLAAMLGARAITVNAVEPGPIRTEMLAATFAANPEIAAAVGAMAALGRPGEPAEVADAVAFFASDDARFITGQYIGVDGGLLL